MNYLLIIIFLFCSSLAWGLEACIGSPIKTKVELIPKAWDNCKGVFINTNKGYEGDTYQGTFKNGSMNGEGILVWADGTKYQGEFKNNLGDGTATVNWLNGEKYIGEFKNGKRDGKGTHYWPDGEKYIGEFKNGKRHGKGTYIYKSKNSYIGEYKNDKRDGKGVFIWINGGKYIGEFKKNKFNGQGTLFYKDGKVWEGKWYNDKWINGNKYAKGEYDKNNINYKGNEGIEKEDDSNNINKKNLDQELKIKELEKELAEIKALQKKEKKQISADIIPPSLFIISSEVIEKKGIIIGTVKDNHKVAEVTINEKEIKFSNSGSFTHTIFVPKDGIKITIKATDYAGLTNKKIITLNRKVTINEESIIFSKLNPLSIQSKKNKNALAVIIGISKYENVSKAKYADRDANFFYDFAESVLGIKKNNIKFFSNEKATNVNLKKALKIWLKSYTTSYLSDIYVFFAGHGLTSLNGKELYLLPYDGEPRLLEDTALLRSEIFDTVKSINPKSVTVFLDTCYSGQTREKDMILADARPITIVPTEGDIPENFTVFSASSGSEISGSLPEADHGLFSYFLMKGLEGDADTNNDKKITNGELYSYVRSNVTRQAVRLGREQTPQLQGDENKVLVEFN